MSLRSKEALTAGRSHSKRHASYCKWSMNGGQQRLAMIQQRVLTLLQVSTSALAKVQSAAEGWAWEHWAMKPAKMGDKSSSGVLSWSAGRPLWIIHPCSLHASLKALLAWAEELRSLGVSRSPTTCKCSKIRQGTPRVVSQRLLQCCKTLRFSHKEHSAHWHKWWGSGRTWWPCSQWVLWRAVEHLEVS